MPKCADVQLQLGSENLLQDIKVVALFQKLQRRRGLPEVDAWICPSALLARPLEAHERRHRHPEFDVWIVVDTVAKTWRRDSCWDKSSGFWCCVWISAVWEGVGHFTRSCRCDFFFSQFVTCITGCGTLFLRRTLVMHASVLETRTPFSIQRRLGSALGCPVLVHLHNGSWRMFKSWRTTEAFLFPLARQV